MKHTIDEIKKMQLLAGLINEVEYNESLWGVDKQPLNEAKDAKKKVLHIDVANPYEYRHGIAHELNELGEYTDEALEKAKVKVLKNLAKDANFYSNLLNQKQSPYEFKQSETDKKGMQARPDGHMKKEAKKDEKANVKDNLGKKEAGKVKPKGVKIMPDKGVTGSEKTIKEGLLNEEISQDDFFDSVIDVLVKDRILTKDDLDRFNSGDNDELMDALFDEWKGYAGYDETGQDVSSSDINLSARAIAKKLGRLEEHHNDPNFPGGTKIHAMLDAVAKDWGKEDLYNELEDAITGWSDRNGELSPKGKIAIKALLSNWDVLDDYGHFLDDTMEEGVSELADENAFEDLVKKYDWYYEMSDDPRVYDRGIDMDKQLKMLSKKIGVEKAVDLFNQKAPKDRKVSASFFMEGEDKHAKLKEKLKQGLKELLNQADIQNAKAKGLTLNISKASTQDIKAAQNAKVNYTTYE